MSMVQYFTYSFGTVENPLSDGGLFSICNSYSALKAVSGNLCEPSAASTNCLMYYNQLMPADQYAEITIPTLSLPGTDFAYLVLRQDPAAKNLYLLVIQGNTASPISSGFTLYAFVGGK